MCVLLFQCVCGGGLLQLEYRKGRVLFLRDVTASLEIKKNSKVVKEENIAVCDCAACRYSMYSFGHVSGIFWSRPSSYLLFAADFFLAFIKNRI